MARFEVTIESRDPAGKPTVLMVDTSYDVDGMRYGMNAQEIASSVASDFCDSGSVVVRRLGGGERAVVGRP